MAYEFGALATDIASPEQAEITGTGDSRQVPIPFSIPRAKSATKLLAPMPGVVTICEKQVGEDVSEGDVVLVLEAMKMENLITAPIAGKLLSSCHEGERVGKGAVLAMIR
jgi:biotin carboxyl carrier protein